MSKQLGWILFFCFTTLFLSAGALAATIQGEIYDYELNPLTEVLIEIDTTPSQQFLSTDGSYSFTLDPGVYTLQARQADLETVEEIVITESEGEFRYDLFLFPSLRDEDELFNDLRDIELDSSLSDQQSQGINLLFWALIIGAFLATSLIAGVLFIKSRTDDQSTQNDTASKHKEEPLNTLAQTDSSDSELTTKVLSLLKANEGRMSQKELRKQLAHLSESKVSLLITELEHKNKVSKVKRGRGNVILLK